MSKRSLIKDVNPTTNPMLALNVLSAVSGFLFFIAIETGLNLYRVQRLTGLGFAALKNIYFIFFILGSVFSTIILTVLNRKWKLGSMSRFLQAVLWFPYFYLFVRTYIALFPFTDPGDVPSAGTGFIVILGILLYPFYLILISLFASKE